MSVSIQVVAQGHLLQLSAKQENKAILLDTFWERFWGLKEYEAKSNKQSIVVGFERCQSVHTFCMRRAIDIAAIDLLGEVIASYKHVDPSSIMTIHKAYWIFERFSCDEEWFEVGERIEIIKNPPR